MPRSAAVGEERVAERMHDAAPEPEPLHQAHDQYVDFVSGWKEAAPPESADLDQAVMADTLASAAVKKQLAIVIAKHLPGAALLATITEPAVIDSTWLFDGHEIRVEWDYRKNFGDPAGLTVTARIEVAR